MFHPNQIAKSFRFGLVAGIFKMMSHDRLRRRCNLQLRDVPSNIRNFVEGYEGQCSPAHLATRIVPPAWGVHHVRE
jgi:hypothetical protein